MMFVKCTPSVPSGWEQKDVSQSLKFCPVTVVNLWSYRALLAVVRVFDEDLKLKRF